MRTKANALICFLRQCSPKIVVLAIVLFLVQRAGAQTFDITPSITVDSMLLKDIVFSTTPDTLIAQHADYSGMSSATAGSGFTAKSVLALTNFKVDVQSPNVWQKSKFTYLITYKTIGVANPANPTATTTSAIDTLSISYDRDSLRFISDRAFNIAGKFHKLMVIIYDVFDVTTPGATPVLLSGATAATGVPSFIYVNSEVHLQKFMTHNMVMPSLTVTNNIASNGTVLLAWPTLSTIKPAGYEVEWTYTVPGGGAYDFRNNATRIFTNGGSFSIPVAQKQGSVVYRVRMVRPDLTDLQSRTYGAWTTPGSVNIAQSSNDSINWDLKMNFVEDGKYKQVVTYYDGLLKPKQVQTRFNSRPGQTVVAQSLFDHEGRAVINSLPIPVDSVTKFGYMKNFLRPTGKTEYSKAMYDTIVNPNPPVCPPKEIPIPALDPAAKSNLYYSRGNAKNTGRDAFIPDAEGYPLVRKILAAENSEKVLFEGQAGAKLQLGNDRQTSYLYGSPLQAELNRYFGQDIGQFNYYRKMLTTDNNAQDMFSITDDEGRMVATGLIGVPDTFQLALSVEKAIPSDSFKSNLLPIPDVRLDENWKVNGSHFVERQANYDMQYRFDYKPFKPCSTSLDRLQPKIYYKYELINSCGVPVIKDSNSLGGVGTTQSASLTYTPLPKGANLPKGNYTWNKHSYVTMDDITASVDIFLNNVANGCYKTFNDFLREEFLKAKFPCSQNYDPCEDMKYAMMQELYPGAKYGQYNYSDPSKTFVSGTTNSIFSPTAPHRYQNNCIDYPNTLYINGRTYTETQIKELPPQKFIEIFNDSIAAALLPLHPDYCKLQLCSLLTNPYAEMLQKIETAAEASAISRYTLTDIVNNDPLKINLFLSSNELSKTVEGLLIDSLALKKTLCGSEFGGVEVACGVIHASKTVADLVNYPVQVRDEYYQNLTDLYRENRENRLGAKVQQMLDTCGPCSQARLSNPIEDSISFVTESDTAFLISSLDTMIRLLDSTETTTFSSYFDAVKSHNLTLDSVYKSFGMNSSVYASQFIGEIMNNLSSCNVSQTLLDRLEDTLTRRFFTGTNTPATLTYDSLTTIMTQIGIAQNDLCNAGLVDIRKIARKAGENIQLGLLQYPPDYYQDLVNFFQTNNLLNFIAGASSSVNVSVARCSTSAFQFRLVQQLNGTASCGAFYTVTVTKTNLNTTSPASANANAVKLTFTLSGNQVDYYLYPTANANALNAAFGAPPISATSQYKMSPLFSLYGFDKLAKTYANRNTILFTFRGTQSGVQKNFGYFLSGFNVATDFNMMEDNRVESLNGIGCSELIQMAKNVVAKAEALSIRAGHPNFENYFSNVMNFQYGINFSYENYEEAMKSCGVTDSILIKKHVAGYRLRFPVATVSLSTIQSYLDSLLIKYDIGIKDIQSYKLGTNRFVLLNFVEANGNTLKASKATIQSTLPSGATYEYMPILGKDSIVVVSDSANTPSVSGLNFTFPTATVTQSTKEEVYYFIPGYGVFTLPGYYTTIKRTIATNYDYNHFLASVEAYMYHNYPMTTVLLHAESAVSPQYADWRMTAWRNHVRSLSSQNHNALVKNSKASRFNTVSGTDGFYTFANSKFSYKNSLRPYYTNDLLIDHQDPNANFIYLKNLLERLEAANQVAPGYTKKTIFRSFSPASTVLNLSGVSPTTPYAHETRAYLCGDTTYFWVNHFDANRNMMNIFIRLPQYLPLPREMYSIVNIAKGLESDTATYLDITFAAQQGGQYDTIKCTGYTNRKMGPIYTIPSAFLTSHSDHKYTSDHFGNCENSVIQALYPVARNNYNLYIDSIRTDLIARFRQHLIDSIQEDLSIFGLDIKHGPTLYYYDMAGNLIKTVSPGGSKTLSVKGADNDTINAYRKRYQKINPKVPAHDKVTWYKYNAQNKVIQTKSPDATAISTTIYDVMGRVVVSQDAKQQLVSRYTYFLYDNLSRVIETGTLFKAGAWSPPHSTAPGTTMTGQIKNLLRTEVTATIYDSASYTTTAPFNKLPPQENLKNRVSCTKYFDAVYPGQDASKDTNYNNALHYSYDISGNVSTLIYDLRTVLDPVLRFKRVDYEYDLYSGKVLMVAYNRGFADQFFQKYAYDSDNRIVEARTSNNGVYWDRDAGYEYYDHGPLARMVLGEQLVQGVDYAYTINGWLKAVNGIQNDTLSDIGQDGEWNTAMPKDVFSQRIDYFNGDYKSITDSTFFRKLPQTNKNLYNGNIAAIAKALTPFDNLYSKYHYDPLQRIDRTNYTKYNYNHATSLLTTTDLPDYVEDYAYDPDGNITKLKREGGTVSAALNNGVAIAQQNMDKFTYRYTTGTNRLNNLQDSSTSTAYKIDVPLTTGNVNLSHYTYDAAGNMTKDLVSGLTAIDWNRFGKVKSITRLDGSQIHFAYDPMGNRLSKELVTFPAADSMVKYKTIYVRDASGNSLAVYEDKKEFDLEKITISVGPSLPGGISGTTGTISADVANAISAKLWAAYLANPNDNLAQLALGVPQLDDYVDNLTLLQNLVASLQNGQALTFVKSNTNILGHALGNVESVSREELSLYLWPVTLTTSSEMQDLQVSLFSTLKERDIDLYYATVATVPATSLEKEQFPSNLALLNKFKMMDFGARRDITDQLAETLVASNQETFPYIADQLITAYSTSNNYAEFVEDLPDHELVYEQLRTDAGSYVTYRYALAGGGSVPIETVRNEFRYNTALADAIASGVTANTAEALTAALSTRFADIISFAQNAGKSANLVSALKKSLSQIDIDVAVAAWVKEKQVLQSDKLHLAEHHIYGSARLGMQKYLPDQLKYGYKPGQSASLYDNLTQPRPWYSRYGEDLFSAAVYTNALSTANINATGMGVNTHILGNRHYELNNHLGNVQATVLDRTSPLLQMESVKGYHANISTAQDYYPFGMLMPGRYISDTIKHCVTINTTVWVPKPIRIQISPASGTPLAYRYGGSPSPPLPHLLEKASTFEAQRFYVYHYMPLAEHPSGWVARSSYSGNDASFEVDLSNEPSGITAYMHLVADTPQSEQQIGFRASGNGEYILEARVRQYNNTGESFYDLMGWTTVSGTEEKTYTVAVNTTAVAAGGKTVLEWRFKTASGLAFPANRRVTIHNPFIVRTELVPENRIATICEEKDDYRFGFNGQEKDNEPKGLANSLDFGARIYDSRLGRFLSMDPLTKESPYHSPYVFGGNTPIQAIDKDGEKVYMVFNKETRTLRVLDLDHFRPNLPTKIVNAKDYNFAGIRDKNGVQTHNQVLEIKGVFSGGRSINGNVTRNLEVDPDQLAIPNGKYDLTEYEGSPSWYKVDPVDNDRYDDEYDVDGVTNANGEKRTGFRLHLGTLSHGCITIDKGAEGREAEYDVLQTIFSKTSKDEVPKREGRQRYLPFTKREKIGEIKVEGKDNIPDMTPKAKTNAPR